jgi:hypothetical protein
MLMLMVVSPRTALAVCVVAIHFTVAPRLSKMTRIGRSTRSFRTIAGGEEGKVSPFTTTVTAKAALALTSKTKTKLSNNQFRISLPL